MNAFFSILLFNAASVLGILLNISLVGLIWMPFAAATCMYVARSKRLNVNAYGIAGAVYSVLFILPWIYLVLRMYGVSVDKRVVRAVYVVLYVYIWMLGVMVLNVIIALDQDWRGIAFLLLFVNMITWIVSADMLRHRNHEDRKEEFHFLRGHSNSEMQQAPLPHFVYLIPFAMVLFWMLVFYLMGLIV